MENSFGGVESGLLVSTSSARPWTKGFTGELTKALIRCPSMDDLDFHNLLLMRVGELVGINGSLQVESRSDPIDHIYSIAYACKRFKDPGLAVSALAIAMRELRGETAALIRLEDCADSINGLTALSVERLNSVLLVISTFSDELRDIDFFGLVHGVVVDGEGLPLRGTEHLPDIVRRLNCARATVAVEIPLVLRFLYSLTISVGENAGSRLASEIEGIADELNLSINEIRKSSLPLSRNNTNDRVLRVRLEEISAPGSQRYSIDAAVFDVSQGRRKRITSWQCVAGCQGHDIRDASNRFLEIVKYLGSAIGIGKGTVEFLLPWSLLGHPVERWGCDDDGHPIGYRFPVVLRSLDRQRKELFYQPWLERWEMLYGKDSGRSIGDRIGWLHHKDGVVPRNANNAGRIIHLTGRHDLTKWLAEARNDSTVGLGLTFSFKHDNPIYLTGIKDAVREGIPLLVWCRENGDVNQLERLLGKVKIRELGDEVRRWRCLTADNVASTCDARYHLVILLDDPRDVDRPSEHVFAAPVNL